MIRIFLIITLLFGISFENPTDQFDATAARSDCLRSSGLKDSSFDFDDIPTDNEAIKKFLVCFYKRLEFQYENGKINFEKFETEFFNSKNGETATPAVEACANYGGETDEEKAVNFTKCFIGYYQILENSVSKGDEIYIKEN